MNKPQNKREDLVTPDAGLLNNALLCKRLERLSGMAWAYTVLTRLDLTLYKANMAFAPHGYPSGKTSSKFNQYIQGKRAPRQQPADSKAYDIVREVEKAMNSTEATEWLNHPLWQIFARDVKDDKLASYLCPDDVVDENGEPLAGMEGKKPFRAYIVNSLLITTEPPADLPSIIGTSQEPKITSFEEYVHVCAMFRLSVKAGYWLGYWLIAYLSNQAAEINDVFRFIRAPFLKMVDDYYGKPPWVSKCKIASC